MIPLHFRLMISPDGEDEGGGVQEGDVDEMHPPRRAGHDASVSQNFRVGTRQVASYIQEMIHDNRREEMRVLLLRYGEDPSEGCGPPPASPLSPPPFLSCFPPLCLLFEPPPPSHHLAARHLETRCFHLFSEMPDADAARWSQTCRLRMWGIGSSSSSSSRRV